MPWPVGFTRAILFFKAPEGEGWSEEYLFSSELTLSDAQSAVSVILSARMQLLSENYVCEYIRLNYPHNSRTLLPLGTGIVLPMKGTNALVDYERLEVGALVTMYTDSGRYAERIFRGVPDDAIDTDGRLNPLHAWSVDLKDFLDILLSAPACCLVNVKATAMFPPYTAAEYTSYNFGRTTTRDSGRPFGLRRGRISA